MNIHYPVPKHDHRSVLWLAAATILASLMIASTIIAIQVLGQLQLVEISHPATVPANLPVPQPVPVPEPPHTQLTPAPRAGVSSSLPESRPLPVPQPVPTPPAGD